VALASATAQFGGMAYRLGGDEFCVVCPRDVATDVEAAAVSALSERGDAFVITASGGGVTLPSEADDPREALEIADQRMYAAKRSGRTTARRQSTDVLVRALIEHHPELGHDLEELAELATEVARRVGMDGDELETVGHAAALHDIGKVAIPTTILAKPAPLDEDEWKFMRQHPLIGERIVGAAPSLLAVARLVRSSHERWDGSGYPDALGGDAIPLGARVVAACDAFNAMTRSRPYARARSVESALEELQRCAGTQFDPRVVAALMTVVDVAASAALA
jgi:HD-GYP domain-containing protein (c-di-GMP phosphodiesterase class II)